MRSIRYAAVLAAAVLCGCATLQPQQSFTTDSGKTVPIHLHRLYGARMGAASPGPVQAPTEINCIQATNTPCSSASHVGSGNEGVPAYLAFGELNDWGLQLGLFANQAANQVESTPCASSGIPTLRMLCGGDIPPINLALIGSNGGVTGILPLAEGGTGTATPGLVAGTNITITGAWPNQTINSSGGSMTWPAAAGIPCYSGSSTWCTSYSASNPIPATDLPTALSSSTSVNGTNIPAAATLLTSGGPLGTPSSGVATNLTGTAPGLTAGLAQGLTGSPAITVSSCTGCGSGGSVTLQTNGASNTSQTTLNLQSGSAVDGITPTVTNTTSGNVQLGLSVNAGNLQAALNSANAQTYSPTLAAGATNDWDPSGGSGVATVGFVYVTPNSAGSTLDGILAGSDKQQFILCNAAAIPSTPNNSSIILENQSSTDTTAANRLMMAGNQALGPQMCVSMIYFAGSIDRWWVGRVSDSGNPPTWPLASAAAMTPDCTFKTNTETASQSAFTVNAPTDCTAVNGQLLELDIVNFTTANAYTWNSVYVGNATVSLPSVGGGANKLDRILFKRDAANSSWDLVSYAVGR